MRVTGKVLAEEYGLFFERPLYRKTGDWYHFPKIFPTALFDANGYVEFQDIDVMMDFLASSPEQRVTWSQEKNYIIVKEGISRLPNYISLEIEGTEIDQPTVRTLFEGALRRVTVNRYERDVSARLRCIKHWGHSCVVCDFNFLERYGDVGRSFIQEGLKNLPLST